MLRERSKIIALIILIAGVVGITLTIKANSHKPFTFQVDGKDVKLPYNASEIDGFSTSDGLLIKFDDDGKVATLTIRRNKLVGIKMVNNLNGVANAEISINGVHWGSSPQDAKELLGKPSDEWETSDDCQYQVYDINDSYLNLQFQDKKLVGIEVKVYYD